MKVFPAFIFRNKEIDMRVGITLSTSRRIIRALFSNKNSQNTKPLKTKDSIFSLSGFPPKTFLCVYFTAFVDGHSCVGLCHVANLARDVTEEVAILVVLSAVFQPRNGSHLFGAISMFVDVWVCDLHVNRPRFNEIWCVYTNIV